MQVLEPELKPKFSSEYHGSEFRQLIRPLFRWWWLLLLVPIFSGAIGYYMVQRGPSYYQARMLLNIGPPANEIQNQIPPLITIRLGISYSQVVKQSSFMATISVNSSNRLSPDEIDAATVVQYTAGTPYFEVQFVDTNRERTIEILNAISELLTGETPQAKELRRKTEVNFVASRRVELAQLIETRKKELENNNSSGLVEGETSGKSISQEYYTSGLKTELNNYTTELEELSKFNRKDEPNQIYVIEQPHIINVVLGPQPKSAALALGLIGLVLAIVVAVGLNTVDNRIHSRAEVEKILGYNVLQEVKPRTSTGVSSASELLVTDLLSSFSNVSIVEKHSVMFVHELYTSNVPQFIQAVASSLTRFGAAVTISVGTNVRINKSETSATVQPDIIETVTSEPRPEVEVFSTEIQLSNNEWEIINQEWPGNPQQLTRFSLESQGVVLLCSLKQSNKKELAKLGDFFRKAPIKVVGVVLI